MRLLRIIPLALLIALVASPAQAWMSPAICGGGVAAGGCVSVCESGATCEGFDGSTACGDGSHTNCELGGWTTNGTFDFNAAHGGTKPTGGCSYAAEVHSWSDAYIDSLTGHESVAFKVYFMVSNRDAWTINSIVEIRGSGGSEVIFRVIQSNNHSDGRLIMVGATSSELMPNPGPTTDQWYLLECAITSNSSAKCRIDGGTDVTVTIGATSFARFLLGGQASDNNVRQLDEFRYKLDTADYF